MALVLYGLSAFSALAIAVLTGSKLANEKGPVATSAFQDIVRNDVEVFVTPLTIPGSWQLPTLNSPMSFQVHTPADGQVQLGSALGSGWKYSVDVVPGLTVCCDGGNNTCNLPNGGQPPASAAGNLRTVLTLGTSPTQKAISVQEMNEGLQSHYVVNGTPMLLTEAGTFEIDPASQMSVSAETLTCGLVVHGVVVARGLVQMDNYAPSPGMASAAGIRGLLDLITVR
jgi:hypothetical protein